MTRYRAIIDTNVVVAGLLTGELRSPTALILDAMLEADIPYLLSLALLAEYRLVLARAPLRRLHQLTDEEIDRLLTQIALNAIVLEPERADTSSPDAGDQHLWDLLLAQPRAILVSGDRQLVAQAPRGGSAISPRAFAELMEWG